MAFSSTQFREALQSAIVGGFCAAMVVINLTATSVLPEFPAAICLIVLAIVFRPLPVIAGLSAFLALGYLLTPHDLFMSLARVAATSLLVCLFRRKLAPVAVVTTTWILVVFAILVLGPDQLKLIPGSAMVTSSALEIAFSILLWFAVCAPTLKGRFNLEHLSHRHFFLNLILTPVLLIAIMLFVYACYRTGMGRAQLINFLQLSNVGVLFAVLGLVLGVVLLGALLSNLLLDYVEQYEKAALSETQVPPWVPFPMRRPR